MGLNVHIDIIFGVPLFTLGIVQFKDTTHDETNNIGIPTGNVITHRTSFITFPNFKTSIIGKSDIAKKSLTVEYDCKIFEDDYDNENFVHPLLYPISLDQIVIGLKSGYAIEGIQMDRFQSYKCVHSDTTNNPEYKKAKEFLLNECGYDGHIFTMAVPYYGF
jgi:hypothetical protein